MHDEDEEVLGDDEFQMDDNELADGMEDMDEDFGLDEEDPDKDH